MNHHTIVTRFSFSLIFPDENLKASIAGHVADTRYTKRIAKLFMCPPSSLKFQKGTTGLQIAPWFRLKSEVVFDSYAAGKKNNGESIVRDTCVRIWMRKREYLLEILCVHDESLWIYSERTEFSSMDVDNNNKMSNLCCAYLKFKFSKLKSKIKV